MKLNLLSIMLIGSGLLLSACNGSDDKSDSPSTTLNVNADINNIQNPVVNTPQPYMPNSPKSRQKMQLRVW